MCLLVDTIPGLNIGLAYYTCLVKTDGQKDIDRHRRIDGQKHRWKDG